MKKMRNAMKKKRNVECEIRNGDARRPSAALRAGLHFALPISHFTFFQSAALRAGSFAYVNWSLLGAMGFIAVFWWLVTMGLVAILK